MVNTENEIEVENKAPIILTTGEGTTHRLNQDVFLIIQNNLAQILDFKHGQFYGLDVIGTLMVSLVLKCGPEETVVYIAKAYNVPEENVRFDLNALLQNLERKKLLIAIEQQSYHTLQLLHYWITRGCRFISVLYFRILKAILSVFHALLNNSDSRTNSVLKLPKSRTVEMLLVLSWISFRLLGWNQTISLWQQWYQQGNAGETLVQREVIQAVDQTVRKAAASKFFLPMVCKERALVAYHILRAFYSLPATLVVGFDRNPFQVHAWVECDEIVLTDNSAHCKIFTPLIKYS